MTLRQLQLASKVTTIDLTMTVRALAATGDGESFCCFLITASHARLSLSRSFRRTIQLAHRVISLFQTLLAFITSGSCPVRESRLDMLHML